MNRYKSRFKETPDQINTPEFKKWFGNSKVVKRGKPLVVYHGSTADFNKFNTETKKLRNSGVVQNTPFIQYGHFFSSSAKTASSYTVKMDREIEEYTKLNSKLKAIENGEIKFSSPKEKWDMWGEIKKEIDRRFTSFEDQFLKGSIYPVYLRITQPLIIDGKGANWNKVLPDTYNSIDMSKHDGIIFKNIIEAGGEKQTTYVVFKPNQIKSAIGNKGTFNLRSDNILESRVKEKLYHPDAIAIDKKPYDIYANPSTSELGKIATIRSDKACRGMIDMRNPKLVLMSSFRLLHSDAIYAVEDIPVGDERYGTLRNHYIRLIFDFNYKTINVDYIPKGKEKLLLNNAYLKNVFSGWSIQYMYKVIGEL